MEIWKAITETCGKYAVSNLGNVKRMEHYTKVGPNNIHYPERLLKQYINKEGYCVVKLQTDDKPVTRKVHQLVAKEFLDNPFCYTQVNHIDENKSNNNVENLEWCNASYNSNYGTRNSRLRSASGIRVAQYSIDGTLLKIWDSISQASQSFGCSTTCCIKRVCKGERRTYRGFVWRYVDKKVIGDDCLRNQMLKNKQEMINIILETFSEKELLELANKLHIKQQVKSDNE